MTHLTTAYIHLNIIDIPYTNNWNSISYSFCAYMYLIEFGKTPTSSYPSCVKPETRIKYYIFLDTVFNRLHKLNFYGNIWHILHELFICTQACERDMMFQVNSLFHRKPSPGSVSHHVRRGSGYCVGVMMNDWVYWRVIVLHHFFLY